MKFVIRDDDLNYFSTSADVKQWYENIFAQNIPVGFSTIPFVTTASDVHPRDREETFTEYPISENRELVEYVRSNDLIEILQHGCTHLTVQGVFEYTKKSGLIEDTFRGKQELEEAFGKRMTIFVPPHDAISNHGILAVESASMDIIRGTGSKNFLLRTQYFTNILIMIAHRLKYLQKRNMPAYPSIVDFGDHREAYSNRLRDENLEEMLQKLEYSFKKGNNFVITTHLHHFTHRRKQNLEKLIEVAKKMGADFVKPSDLFSGWAN